MIYLLVGHRARLPIVVRKEALLYYQIVAVVALDAAWNGECSVAMPFSSGLMRRGN
jgi:hypothetical protein